MESQIPPESDVKVAEFMADVPNGRRYEVRITRPEQDFRYEVRYIASEDDDSLHVDYTFTLRGARRVIRKHRKRVNRYGDQVGSLVYWERF